MPKRVNDDPGGDLTGLDAEDRSGAAEAGRAADEEDVRGDAGDERPRDVDTFDPTSRRKESGREDSGEVW